MTPVRLDLFNKQHTVAVSIHTVIDPDVRHHVLLIPVARLKVGRLAFVIQTSALVKQLCITLRRSSQHLGCDLTETLVALLLLCGQRQQDLAVVLATGQRPLLVFRNTQPLARLVHDHAVAGLFKCHVVIAIVVEPLAVQPVVDLGLLEVFGLDFAVELVGLRITSDTHHPLVSITQRGFVDLHTVGLQVRIDVGLAQFLVAAQLQEIIDACPLDLVFFDAELARV